MQRPLGGRRLGVSDELLGGWHARGGESLGKSIRRQDRLERGAHVRVFQELEFYSGVQWATVGGVQKRDCN